MHYSTVPTGRRTVSGAVIVEPGNRPAGTKPSGMLLALARYAMQIIMRLGIDKKKSFGYAPGQEDHP